MPHNIREMYLKTRCYWPRCQTSLIWQKLSWICNKFQLLQPTSHV